jgi:hypothetical protein
MALSCGWARARLIAPVLFLQYWPNPETWQPAPGAWLPQLALLQASRESRSVSHERKRLAE